MAATCKHKRKALLGANGRGNSPACFLKEGE
nr:MAG TPA: hypothetical protein [Caudoviricetes sp.]